MPRKKRIENAINRTMYFDSELWFAMDKVRGKLSKNEFVNEAVREKIGRKSNCQERLEQIEKIIKS